VLGSGGLPEMGRDEVHGSEENLSQRQHHQTCGRRRRWLRHRAVQTINLRRCASTMGWPSGNGDGGGEVVAEARGGAGGMRRRINGGGTRVRVVGVRQRR
jgi:hypothetical protein